MLYDIMVWLKRSCIINDIFILASKHHGCDGSWLLRIGHYCDIGISIDGI